MALMLRRALRVYLAVSRLQGGTQVVATPKGRGFRPHSSRTFQTEYGRIIAIFTNPKSNRNRTLILDQLGFNSVSFRGLIILNLPGPTDLSAFASCWRRQDAQNKVFEAYRDGIAGD